jgi:hypothetical protein
VYGRAWGASGAGVRAEGNGAATTALEIRSGAISVPGAGAGTATPAFIHVATTANSRSCDGTGCYCYSTVIDHPMCNNDSSAILFVMVNGEGRPGQRPLVDYIYFDWDVSKWVISCIFNYPFCAGQKFNVLVIKP